MCFIRIGTLDNPDAFPPDAHIYVDSKQPWLPLPEGARSFAGIYDVRTAWPAESLARLAKLRAPSGA